MEKENNPQIAQIYAEKRDEQTFAIIGAAMSVHSELGCGFLEAVYKEALSIEFSLKNITFEIEKQIFVYYKGKKIQTTYRADFICYDSVIVELKAINTLSGIEEAQALNYLKASGIKRALIINFGRTKLEYKRLVLNYKGCNKN